MSFKHTLLPEQKFNIIFITTLKMMLHESKRRDEDLSFYDKETDNTTNKITALGRKNGDTKCLNFKKVKYY